MTTASEPVVHDVGLWPLIKGSQVVGDDMGPKGRRSASARRRTAKPRARNLSMMITVGVAILGGGIVMALVGGSGRRPAPSTHPHGERVTEGSTSPEEPAIPFAADVARQTRLAEAAPRIAEARAPAARRVSAARSAGAGPEVGPVPEVDVDDVVVVGAQSAAYPEAPLTVAEMVAATAQLIPEDGWVSGRVLLEDSLSFSGQVGRSKDGVVFRQTPDDKPSHLPLSEISDITFDAPSTPYAQVGEYRFRRGDFEGARAQFEKGAATSPDFPYYGKRILDVEQAQRTRDAVAAALAAGEHRNLIESVTRYVELVRPARISPAWRRAVEHAWAREAGRAERAERERWADAAAAVGLGLEYDERAPEYLIEAIDAVTREAPAAEQVALFERALRAHAPFDDEAYFLMARSCAAARRKKRAIETVELVSAAYAERPEVRALLVSLGLVPPPLSPTLVFCSRVGGGGDQYIRKVGFSSPGVAFAEGKGFKVVIDGRSGKGMVYGDVASHDDAKYDPRPPLPRGKGKSVRDPRNGQTYHIGYRQVHSILQQPFLTSTGGWSFWGWNYKDVNPGTKGVRWGPLMADSRGYDCWLMPKGRIAVKCWTDGGNSVLTRDPRDLGKPNPIEKLKPRRSSAGGMASLFLLIDPEKGTPLSGTFVRSHMTHQAVDPWGRVYLPRPMDRASNPFGMSAEAGGGLFVLRPDLLRPELNIRIGGGKGTGAEKLGHIALQGNLLVMGGTTAAVQLRGVNAVQSKAGGGQDALVVVVRLWPD